MSKNNAAKGAANITDKKGVIKMCSKKLTHVETDLLMKYLNFSVSSVVYIAVSLWTSI